MWHAVQSLVIISVYIFFYTPPSEGRPQPLVIAFIALGLAYVVTIVGLALSELWPQLKRSLAFFRRGLLTLCQHRQPPQGRLRSRTTTIAGRNNP